MNTQRPPLILEETRLRFKEIVESENLLDMEVEVLARPLTPEEAIGEPGRRDYPIIVGKERIIESSFLNAKGHAFTDSAREFKGTLAQVLDLPLTSNSHRAIFIAVLNAVLAHLGLVHATVHCKDDEPEECGASIANRLLERFGRAAIGLIGLNPAIAEHLVRVFGADRVRISDLCQDNQGKERFGVEIWDETRTRELIEASDVVLVTGTTLQNGTFDDIRAVAASHGTQSIIFGVTGAGVCALNGIERMCPCGREG